MRNLIISIVFMLCMSVPMASSVETKDLSKVNSCLNWYKSYVVSVYDGDTFRVRMESGLDMNFTNVAIRLADVDTPEVRGDEKEEGIKVRDAVRELILDKVVYIRVMSRGIYNRWIADVYYENPDDEGSLVNLSSYLLENGMAEEYGSD